PAAARYLGVASPPDWVLEPRALRLLPHFAALKPRARALARELLRARAGPPPWDLRDHPANRGFLDRLGAAGIDTRAWIDGIGTIERETAVGRIRLALADDPLDVFHMGRHFGTCLSPGAFNFFAVVANAADINKRVLYARAEAGAVIGRQLLCLTDAGSLLAFHPYTHDERTGFADLASELVRELARRMGTSLASQGQVSPLVAADWYDDGPVDLTGQLGFLVDGTTFRDALASVAVADLPALIASELKSGVLDPQVAPMILDLPELLARPELVHAVLPMIRDPAELSHLARLRAASLLEAAGAAGEAADRFGDAIERSVEEQFRAHGSAAIEPIDILCRIAPARGLRALRNTRPSGVRSWSDESLASRLLAGATALEALHRPAQARELLRRAARARGPRHAVVLARERLGEVG
ncbi:MAG TPA: hypothetical protein VEL05_00330, partial [Candidatus Acidoferrum sp.]|nr:hypothetical protein [Candidatus Acidoferrum sp.]